MTKTVKIDQEKQLFYLSVDSFESVLNFRELAPGVLEYYRTYVPLELRGQGIAQILVDFALKYARENHFTVLPSCSYIRRYIDNHPQWADIVKS